MEEKKEKTHKKYLTKESEAIIIRNLVWREAKNESRTTTLFYRPKMRRAKRKQKIFEKLLTRRNEVL